jgi:hypothetical protein
MNALNFLRCVTRTSSANGSQQWDSKHNSGNSKPPFLRAVLSDKQHRHSFDSDVRQLAFCCPDNKGSRYTQTQIRTAMKASQEKLQSLASADIDSLWTYSHTAHVISHFLYSCRSMKKYLHHRNLESNFLQIRYCYVPQRQKEAHFGTSEFAR